MSRKKYILGRTVQTIFLLWLAMTFIFALMQLLPGSYLDVMVMQGASSESIQALEEKWGINQPIHVQYIKYSQNLLTLDAGQSFVTRQPVVDYVAPKIFNSAILIVPGVTIAYLLGSVAGSVLGYERGSTIERWGLVGTLITGSVPEFIIAIFLVLLFGSFLNLFPVGGLASVAALSAADKWWEIYFTKSFLYHFTLPLTAVIIRYFYFPTIMMRTSVVEVSGQDFMDYHRITGFKKSDLIRRLIKHASLPVITFYPISIARALSGLVLIELVFGWPGIGHTLVSSIFNRDTATVQFILFITAAFIIVSNFVVDIAYTYIDPRITMDSSSE